MASVFLHSVATDAYGRSVFECLKQSHERCRFGVHHVAESPESADLIIFAEKGGAGPYFDKIRRSPLFRAHRRKCHLYCTADKIIPLIPGVYPDLTRRTHTKDFTRSGHYLQTNRNTRIRLTQVNEDARYLYSFVGALRTHEVRKRFLEFDDTRGLVRDTSKISMPILMHGTKAEREVFFEDLAVSMEDSKFVLCPRGVAASSIRLFESMEAGRAPVILSDGFVFPEGPDWAKFSIHIPEAEVLETPRILAARQDEASGMGMMARKAWEEWFSPEVSFHRIVEWCLSIRSSATAFTPLRPYANVAHFMNPWHLRNYLRWTVRGAKL